MRKFCLQFGNVIDNIGSIPVKVYKQAITQVTGLDVTWTGPAQGAVIMPGYSVPGDIHVHVNGDAPNAIAEYTIAASILVNQFNVIPE